MSTLAEMLARANGRRRERTLNSADVESIVAEVQDGSPWAFIHGGDVPHSYGYFATTTIALAARVDGIVYCGISVSPAHAASPGRAWECLQPWSRGDMTPRLRAWTKEADVGAVVPVTTTQ